MLQLLFLVVSLIIQGYPTAYIHTNVPPASNMRPLGAVNITILFPENGTYVGHCLASTIDSYVVWLNPQHPPMYSIHTGDLWGMFDEGQLSRIECDNPN